MTLSWFKLHHGAVSDPKWLAIADIAGSSPATVYGTFSWALDYASQREDRGSIAGIDLQDIASFFRVPLAEVERIFAAFVRRGLIAGERIAKWVKRQGEAIGVLKSAVSPSKLKSPGARRTAAWRQRKHETLRQPDLFAASHPPVTASQTGVTVTGQDKDSESDCALPSGASARARSAPVVNLAEEKTARAARRTRLPPDWQPGPEGCAYAARLGYDEGWIGRQADRFSDHHRARGTLMADWAAAWRTWVGRAEDFGGNAGPGRTGGDRSPRPGGLMAAYGRILARHAGDPEWQTA